MLKIRFYITFGEDKEFENKNRYTSRFQDRRLQELFVTH
jgi:hypothetical protein